MQQTASFQNSKSKGNLRISSWASDLHWLHTKYMIHPHHRFIFQLPQTIVKQNWNHCMPINPYLNYILSDPKIVYFSQK